MFLNSYDELALPTASSRAAANPDGENLSYNNSIEAEEVWPEDVEAAFYEALKIFPTKYNKKRIKMDNGKAYGRNYLIACYIKQKCGKIRSAKQISSHQQVITRKQESCSKMCNFIQNPKQLAEAPISGLPIKPQNYVPGSTRIISQTQSLTVPNVSPLNFIRNPIGTEVSDRAVSHQQIIYVYDLITRQILLHDGLNFSTLPRVNFSSVQHLFGATLPALLKFVPLNGFYLVKGRINLENNFTACGQLAPNNKIFDSQLFYSPYKMDTIGMGCSYGNRVNFTNIKSTRLYETVINNQIHFIYGQEILLIDYGIPIIKELSKLHKEAGIEAVKMVLSHLSWLTIYIDKNTSECLLAISYIFEHTHLEPSYLMYRLLI